MRTGKRVVMKLIVLGIEEMDSGMDRVEAADLLLKGDELIAFVGVTGNGEAGDGKLEAEAGIDGGSDDGVVAEDFLDFVGIGGIAADANAGGRVPGKAGAAEAEGIGRLGDKGRDRDAMNVGLGELQDEAELGERFFEAKEPEVVKIDGGKLVGSGFECKGEDRDPGTPDILDKVGIGTFDGDAGLFSWDDSGGVFDAVKDAVVDFLGDVIDGDGSAGRAETAAAAVACGRGEEGAVGSEDVKAQKAEHVHERHESVKDLLVATFAEASAEVGEGGLAGSACLCEPSQAPVVETALGIAQDGAEVADIRNTVEIAEQVEQEERDGIVAGAAENGIGIGGDGADEGEVDDGSDELGQAAANGAVVVDLDEFLAEAVAGEPATLLFGKRFGVSAVNGGIDFAEFPDKIADREQGEFAHRKAPRVSREVEPPSRTLSGSPFLFSSFLHQTPTQGGHLTGSGITVSSSSIKTGRTAERSLACA